jgi:F-type H+-transporting ATPase subunit epsilon
VAEKFALQVISPQRIVFEGEVQAVYAPGAEGEFGILPGHAPYLVQLKIGELRILADDKWTYAAVSGGFSEVEYKSMKILAETCELGHEIDVQRAKAAKQRAEEKLKAKIEADEFADAEAALQRALVRLKVAERNG